MSDHDNIVLITVDSLRADYCGFTGGSDSHTPVMDQLAEDGMVFENAIAPGPATIDSMPVIFSGQFYPRPEDDWSAVEEPELIRNHMHARETIPERLSRRGYETAAFTTNPWTSRRYGFDEDFDHFEDFMDVESTGGTDGGFLEQVAKNDDGGASIKSLQLLLDWRRQNDMFQSWETFYDEVVAWASETEEPYFIWIFLVDAHMPFFPPSGFHSQSRMSMIAANLWLYLDTRRFETVLGERLRRAYGDAVRYVDNRIGQMVEDLKDSDPIVVVHGDHGEEFGERGIYGHGQSLSEELINVPLLVANGPVGRVHQPFSLADLPTLLERIADGRQMEDVTKSVVQSRNLDPKTAVRGVDWKYVEGEDERNVLRVGNGTTPSSLEDPDRLSLGQDIAARWKIEDTERRRIVRAVADVCD